MKTLMRLPTEIPLQEQQEDTTTPRESVQCGKERERESYFLFFFFFKDKEREKEPNLTHTYAHDTF